MTTYKCDLVLTNPNFSFDGPATSTEVILSFALTGTVTLQNPDKTWQGPTELPAGLLLAITSQLSAVTGSTHPESPGSRFIPATPPTSPSGDTGVNLATAGTTSALVIYIPKEEGTGGSVSILEGTVPVDPNTKAFLASLIKGQLCLSYVSTSYLLSKHVVALNVRVSGNVETAMKIGARRNTRVSHIPSCQLANITIC